MTMFRYKHNKESVKAPMLLYKAEIRLLVYIQTLLSQDMQEESTCDCKSAEVGYMNSVLKDQCWINVHNIDCCE